MVALGEGAVSYERGTPVAGALCLSWRVVLGQPSGLWYKTLIHHNMVYYGVRRMDDGVMVYA